MDRRDMLRILLAGGLMLSAPVAFAIGTTHREAMQQFVRSLLMTDAEAFLALVSKRGGFAFHLDMTGNLTLPSANSMITRDELARDFAAHGDVWQTIMGGAETGLDCFADSIIRNKGEDWKHVGGARYVLPEGSADSLTFSRFRQEEDGWYLDAIGYPVV